MGEDAGVGFEELLGVSDDLVSAALDDLDELFEDLDETQLELLDVLPVLFEGFVGDLPEEVVDGF